MTQAIDAHGALTTPSASAADAPPGTGQPPPHRWRWVGLFVILAAEVMDLLDALVTNIAGPSIRAGLGGTASLIQWLGAGYTVAMAVGLITGGRIGDLYGRRRMFVVGALGFTAASVLCGLAQSPEMLVGARVLQGLLGAVMLPQGLGLIREMFPPKEMAAAFGAFGPVMGLSAVGGPILAGWLVDADLFGTGWRAIFLINVPLGLLAVAGALKFLPESRSPRASRLDLVGVGLASVAVLLVIFPAVRGRELDWPAWTFASMAASVGVFAVFGWYEVRRYRSGRDPLVVPSLFRKRAFTGGMLAGLLFFASLIGFSLVFGLYVQIGLGYSPLKAGLAGVPQAAGMVVAFIVAGAGLSERFGRRLIHAGMLVVIAGTGGVLATLQLAGIDVTPWQLAPSLVVTGFGMGLVMAPFFNIVLAGVEPSETGSASGTLTAIQQLGAAFGIAVLGTVFFSAFSTHVASGTDAVAPRLRGELAAASASAPDQDRIVAALRACGHDRASGHDPAATPASCRRLTGTVMDVATSPQAGGRMGQAVASAGRDAARHGFADAMRTALWVELALLVVTFAVAFTLPLRARFEDDPALGH